MVSPEGFGDEVVGPPLQGLHCTLYRAVPGDNDHRHVGITVANLLQHFKSSHHRHLEVAEDYVNRVRSQNFQSFSPVGSSHDVIALGT